MMNSKGIEMPNTLSAGILVLTLLAAMGCGSSEEPDTTAPGAVTGLSATAGNGEIVLGWDASDAEDFSHYLVYQGTSAASMSALPDEPDTTGLIVSAGLVDGTAYFFGVSAVDEAGNESSRAGPVQAVATSDAYKTSLGWSDFQTEDYSAASVHFQDALTMNGSYADAHLGLGWSRAYLGQLADAVSSLHAANNNGLSAPDAHAGLAVVYRDLPELDACVSRAAMVLSADPAWEFSHRSSIDYQDMHLIRAQAYYRMGPLNYPDAQGEVDILDPSNGLDPADPGTWTVDGQDYPSYAEALLKAIELLAVTIGTP